MTTITINGIKFQIIPFNARKATNVERKLMCILLPVVAPMLNSKGGLDGDIDMSTMGLAFQQAFGSLSDNEFFDLILETLSSTTAVLKDKAPILIENEQAFNEVFTGSTLTIYKLIWEIIKVNKFCFLELMDGLRTTITDSSVK